MATKKSKAKAKAKSKAKAKAKAKTKAKAKAKAKTKTRAHAKGATLPSVDSLLKGRSIADFDSRQLSRKAHVRWRRDELYAAFLLFDAAARRARASGDTISETSSSNRAAIVLFRSGSAPDEARKRLRAVLAHYRKHRNDIEDRHFVDWAMTSLLEDAASQAPSVASFTKTYRAACKEATALLVRDSPFSDGPFPRIHTERLAKAALSVGAYDIARELIAARRARKPLPRKVKQRLEDMERLIPIH